MKQRALLLPLSIGTLVVVALTISLALMHASGCIDDVKTGSTGSPIRALEVEGQAFGWELLATTGAAYFAWRARASTVGVKVVRAAGAVAILCVVLFVVGVEAQTAGIRECSLPKLASWLSE